MTQEEFNALMDVWLTEHGGEYNSAHSSADIDAAVQKYKDGNIYQVTNADVYSTEETIVGQWIDGRPIYRKSAPVSFFTSTGSFTNSLLDCSDLDIDGVVNLIGMGGIDGSYPGVSLTSGDGALYLNPDKQVVFYNSTMGDVFITGFVSIEYIKTTDEPTTAIPDAATMAAAYDEGVQVA